MNATEPKHILVPISHTVGTCQLGAAEEYALAFQANLVLVHVLPRPNAHHDAAARAYLDTLVDHLAGQGLQARAVVRFGKLAPAIVAEAQRIAATAIVLGVSRRPAVVGAVVGSVSEAVVRAAACPVVLVHRPRGTDSRQVLWDFDEAAARAGPLTRRLPRFETVDIERIVGSVGRANELGADFRPRRAARRDVDEDRFREIRTALEQGRPLPAVDLYQLGSGFYVLDGHHRVAAALLLGQAAIDANVEEYVPVGRGLSAHIRPTRQGASSQAAEQPRLPLARVPGRSWHADPSTASVRQPRPVVS